MDLQGSLSSNFDSTPHLFKGTSDPKQNGTQEKTPFASSYFYALARSMQLHFLNGQNASNITFNEKPLINCSQKLTVAILNNCSHEKKEQHQARKWCVFLFSILFKVTWAFERMWHHIQLGSRHILSGYVCVI